MFVHDKEQIVVGPVRIGKWHALAEAIREGCILRPHQCFGRAFDYKSSCAMGAAIEGAGGKRPARVLGDCPDCGIDAHITRYGDLVPHLNDEHRWTREAIADWLDTL